MRHLSLWFFVFTAANVLVLALSSTPQPLFDDVAKRYTRRTPGGIHLPIVKRESPTTLERRGLTAAIGLGDFVDVGYTVLLTLGGITTPLILDTGSSDMWVMSDACIVGCLRGVKVYPQSSFRSAGADVTMAYGDSQTGTFATGLIGEDSVSLAGVSLNNQYFAAINQTNTTVMELGAAGIFGLGFPVNSVIWNDIFTTKNNLTDSIKGREIQELEPLFHKPNVKFGSPFPSLNLRRLKFPTLPKLLRKHLSSERSNHKARQASSPPSSILYAAFQSWSTLGPFLPRLINDAQLDHPMFTVTLQRNTIDVGGNVGLLSIGELPSGVNPDDLTWVPLRAYKDPEGGIPAPVDSPKEVYPITWEIMVDDVYFDGEKLPRSTISPPTIGLSALVDTGNSLIRGPEDVVENIRSKLGDSGRFKCSDPHTLTFQIGGKMFPVDARDFVTQAFEDNVELCFANLAPTDPPRIGGYQFSWSLGTPFLKGVLSSYYFGNLTHPSVDEPRLGLLSTVPQDSEDLLKAAVVAAQKANHNFPAVSQAAPTGTPTPARTAANGIPQAPTFLPSSASSSARHHSFALGLFLALNLVFGL